MSALEVSELVVGINGTTILEGVDLAVAPGETLALLGPSGSGKTTLLSAIAGFIRPESGRVVVDGITVSHGRIEVGPDRRSIGFVFQSYALWPHLSALATVAFPMVASGVGRKVARARASEILDVLDIGDLADRRPADMSGGQQQRVGLARALARDAALFLLDEPTAHLDAPTRAAAEVVIASQRVEHGAAAVYATHDAGEALAIADRIVVLREGRIVQEGSPRAVYEAPSDAWVAALTGPASVFTADQRSGSVVVGDVMLSADGAGDGRRELVVRPEWVRLGGPARAVVRAVRFRGPHTDIVLETPVGLIDARVSGVPAPSSGATVGWNLDRVCVLGP